MAEIPTMACPECGGDWRWMEHASGCGSSGECECGGIEVNCDTCTAGRIPRRPLTPEQVLGLHAAPTVDLIVSIHSIEHGDGLRCESYSFEALTDLANAVREGFCNVWLARE